jgi:hypothetical protein
MGTTNGRGLWLRFFLISASFGFAASAFAAGINAKTTYSISNGSADARTEYKQAPADLDAKFKDKLWEQFAKKLKDMPLVGDVQAGDVEEKKTDPGTWSDYMTISRNFSAFVQINLQKPVTMLFSVEQRHTICKTPEQLLAQGQTPSTSSTCDNLNTTLAVKGPIAVYGTFETESNLDVTGMLRDKQRLQINVSRSYDKTSLNIDSSLYVDSLLFEKSLFKFFDVFNVGGISKKSEDLTRQNIFLGVARIMRQSNERMLEL